MPIGVPRSWVLLDVGADAIEGDIIANDPFIIIALPNPIAGVLADLVDFAGGDGFEILDDRAYGSRFGSVGS